MRMNTAQATTPAKSDIAGEIWNCTKNIAAIAAATTAMDASTRPSRPPGSRLGSATGATACAGGWPAEGGAELAALPAGGFELSCVVIVFQGFGRFVCSELRKRSKRHAM